MNRRCWLGMTSLISLVSTSVSAQDPLTVGLATGFEPYQFVSTEGQATGFDVDVATAILNELQADYRFQAYTWDDVMSLLRHHAIDIAVGAEVSAARKPYFLFTDSYYTRQPALLTLANNQNIRRVKDLVGEHITGDRHSSLEAYLSQLGLKSQFRIEQMSSKSEAMNALAKGEVKAVIMPKRVAFYIADKLNIKLKVLWESPQPTPVGFGVTSTNPELVKRINRSLDTLRANGTLQRIKAKWSINDPAD
tara:strand:- start:1116 stop:1865 length:750 start_codon:yes stop_codon:yes gene_type:complete